MFTCETRGSSSLTLRWMNDQYGIQIIFSTPDPVGAVRCSDVNPNTNATLINNTIDNEKQLLISELHIKALAQFSAASISCSDNANVSIIEFEILGKVI